MLFHNLIFSGRFANGDQAARTIDGLLVLYEREESWEKEKPGEGDEGTIEKSQKHFPPCDPWGPDLKPNGSLWTGPSHSGGGCFSRRVLVAQTVKASAYNAGYPASIPLSGSFPGKGNGNPLQYFCLKISWSEEPGSPWGLGRAGHDWVSEHTQAVLNSTQLRILSKRPCFWVRKFNSKGNFKDFLEESLVFVGGHCASDADSVCPQAVLACHYAPRATASTWVNIPYQSFFLVLKLAVISTLNGAGMKGKVERKGSLGGKYIEHLTQPTSLQEPSSEWV